jgi:exonuclease VII small subunit
VSDAGPTLGYAEALAELETRAAELVDLCRARVAGARLAVEEVVTDLDGTSPEA